MRVLSSLRFPFPPLTTRQGHSLIPARKNRGPVAFSVGGCAGADRGAGRRARAARKPSSPASRHLDRHRGSGRRLTARFLLACRPKATSPLKPRIPVPGPSVNWRNRPIWRRIRTFVHRLEVCCSTAELSSGAAGWNRTTDLRTDRSGALPLSYNRVFRPPVRRRTQGWQCRLRGWSFLNSHRCAHTGFVTGRRRIAMPLRQGKRSSV